MVCDQVLLLCFASAYVQCVHVHCQIAHSDQWLSFKDWNGFAFGTVKGRIKVSAWQLEVARIKHFITLQIWILRTLKCLKYEKQSWNPTLEPQAWHPT